MITTTRPQDDEAPKGVDIHYGLLSEASKPKPVKEAALARFLSMGMTEEEAKQLLKA